MITLLRALGGALFLALTIIYGFHFTPPEATAQIAGPWKLYLPLVFKSDVNIVNTLVTSGLTQPVHITHAGDGSGRIFVVEQAGRIRVILGGLVQPNPFLDITGRVNFAGEQGLLSLAFPPGFSEKKYFYVYYTNLNGDNRVSRFHLDPGTGLADPAREDLIIYFNHPTFANHNGGQIAFGPDGYLYIGTGDGGGGGDPLGNAQNPGALLGKILRIAVEPLPSIPGTAGPGYRIPPDNPFLNNPGFLPEIWALGLRNPWRFSFDRQNGDLYVGDVGQGEWEEVNFQPGGLLAGRNYGWNIMEGAHCYNAPTCNTAGLTLPVSEYPHTIITHDDNGCSITGGFVYRGPGNPDLQGIYFFGDYCTGRIWGLRQNGGVWQQQELLHTLHNISTFGEDQAGNLYYADMTGGVIYRIEQGIP